MTTSQQLMDEVRTLIDEGDVRLHLLTMELKDEWHALVKRFQHMEQTLEREIEKLGQDEEKFFVGSEADIRALLNDIKKHYKNR
ncbi:Uncharacterised protein [BD1-7 clade bacterium]|uniref:Uncharacterized protein n=1 Tax=BD1-7 clade bacterium TaxID=2029982 RepID=A0A5S9QAV7_9GAMM|nr:Uncharacterised protein [BD1-7 clade bacterium]CAA0118969.1 Uncharacterised protein [BD1-7 clade bacterium]